MLVFALTLRNDMFCLSTNENKPIETNRKGRIRFKPRQGIRNNFSVCQRALFFVTDKKKDSRNRARIIIFAEKTDPQLLKTKTVFFFHFKL